MGGWYDDFCPGAHFGQYVSALARFAAATGFPKHHGPKSSRLVQLDSDRRWTPPVSSSSICAIPGYTYDKLVLRASSTRIHGPATGKLFLFSTPPPPPLGRTCRTMLLTDEEKHTRPHKDETYTWDETYTMAENLFLAYERTNDRMFFDMGRRYLLDRTFFRPAFPGPKRVAPPARL